MFEDIEDTILKLERKMKDDVDEPPQRLLNKARRGNIKLQTEVSFNFISLL